MWFLVAVGVWNFFGAGVFGFLINLPVVSYYEIGTNLTANHGHTAMMGVYGMLAVGLLLFCLRYLSRPDKWSDRVAPRYRSGRSTSGWPGWPSPTCSRSGSCSFTMRSAEGYWHARSLDFLMQRWVHMLEWARLPGDALFIVGGALPLLWLCVRAVRYPNPARQEPGVELETALFTEAG